MNIEQIERLAKIYDSLIHSAAELVTMAKNTGAFYPTSRQGEALEAVAAAISKEFGPA